MKSERLLCHLTKALWDYKVTPEKSPPPPPQPERSWEVLLAAVAITTTMWAIHRWWTKGQP